MNTITTQQWKQYQNELVTEVFSSKVSGTMVVEFMAEAIRVDQLINPRSN